MLDTNTSVNVFTVLKDNLIIDNPILNSKFVNTPSTMINLPYQLSQRTLKDIFIEFPTEVRLRHLRKIQEKKIWAKNLHLKLFNGKISAEN